MNNKEVSLKFFNKIYGNNIVSIAEFQKNVFTFSVTTTKGKMLLVREMRGCFWRKKKVFKDLVSELSELSEDDCKEIFSSLQIDIENSYNKYCKSQFDRSISEHSEHSEENVGLREVLADKLSVLKNPSIGVFTFTSYTMFTVPRFSSDKYQEQPYLVFSNGESMPLTMDAMKEKGIYFKFIPFYSSNRWSHDSLERFLDKKTTSKETYNVFSKIIKKYKEHIDFYEGEEEHLLLTLWTIGTYLHFIFKAYPYIHLHGIRASGKTKCADVTNQMAFNSINSSQMSGSSLFRTIHAMSSTIMIDEGESLKSRDRKQIFRELLLSGYKQGTKTYRTEETQAEDRKTFIVREFDLYSPKLIANISGLEEVLGSRCILVSMKPTLERKIGDKEVDMEDKEWQEIRDLLYLFMMHNWKTIKKEYNKLENDGTFKNREWELWKPLLTLAKFFTIVLDIETDIYEKVRELAIKKVKEARMEDVAEVIDFHTMSVLLKMVKEDAFYPIKDIHKELGDFMGYGEKKPNWFNRRYVGALLKRLGFKTKRRVASGVETFLTKKEVVDQAMRMGINIPEKKKKIIQKKIKEVKP